MQVRKKDGTYTNKADMAVLVQMVREETDIIKVYDWLDANLEDPRTKWNYLKQALKLAIDNGDK